MKFMAQAKFAPASFPPASKCLPSAVSIINAAISIFLPLSSLERILFKMCSWKEKRKEIWPGCKWQDNLNVCLQKLISDQLLKTSLQVILL